MTDDEITQALRAPNVSASPLAVLNLLLELTGHSISQFKAIRHLQAAFPQIPLHIFIEASTSRLVVGPEGMGGEEFGRLLGPWFEATDS